MEDVDSPGIDAVCGKTRGLGLCAELGALLYVVRIR
jgi:hypothetical protein